MFKFLIQVLLLVNILIHPEDLAFPINLKILSDRYGEQM